jgi:Pyruvate phosphate dikinase, AMP/ATP-binding domain
MALTYDFVSGQGVGRDVLGGKGHGLAAMAALGIPVPTGFIIGTPVHVAAQKRSERGEATILVRPTTSPAAAAHARSSTRTRTPSSRAS